MYTRIFLIGFFTIIFINWFHNSFTLASPHSISTLNHFNKTPSSPFITSSSFSNSLNINKYPNSSVTSTNSSASFAIAVGTDPLPTSLVGTSDTQLQTNSSHEANTSLFIAPLASAASGADADVFIDNSFSTDSAAAPKFTNYSNRLGVLTNNSEATGRQDEETVADEYQIQRYLEDIREYIFPKVWKWVLIALHIFVFIVGLLGNFLVCVAVYRNYAMRTVTNYFIVNLAVADFLVILFCLPPTVIWDVTSTWFFGDFMCKTVLYVQTVSVTVSVLTLTFISIDRWYAICYPLRFKSTTRRAKTAIYLIWLIALALDIPELIVNETKPFDHEYQIESVYFTQCLPIWNATIERNFTISRIVLLYFLPLLLMSIFYVQIICVLWQSGTVTHNGVSGTRQFNFSMVSNASTKGQLRTRKKAAKMLVSIVAMFAFCYFPVHLLSLMRLVVRLSNNEFNNGIAMISHWLCYANSAFNPIIYNFMSGKFRKEFHRTMNCKTNSRDSRLELNTVYKLPVRKTFSWNSFGRTDTTRTTITTP